MKIGDLVNDKSHNLWTKVYHIGKLQGYGRKYSVWGFWCKTKEEAERIKYNKLEKIASEQGCLTYCDHAQIVGSKRKNNSLKSVITEAIRELSSY